MKYLLLLSRCAWILCILVVPFLAQSQVVLNEICADNLGSVKSPGGTSPDYIEIYNTGTSALLLDGWSVTDDLTVPAKYLFPDGTAIPGNGFLILWLDTRNDYAGLVSTNFSLKATGEEVSLFQGGTRMDSVKFGPQISDRPLSRIPDGTGNWILGQASPLAANKAINIAQFGTNTALRLNEWLATNSAGATFDWLEIYNPSTNGIVSMGGLVISDMISSLTTPVTVPAVIPNTFIDSGACIRFWCDSTTNKGTHLAFKLNSSVGETLSIYQPDRSTIIDRVTFGPQTRDTSMGRLPDGGTNVFFFAGTNNMSPGSANVWQPLPEVVINEVLTHTDAPLEDAIELYNPTAAPVNISSWYLSNNEEFPRKFRIPAGTILPPGGYKVFYEQNQLNAASIIPGFNRSGIGNSPDFTFNSAHGDLAVLTKALPNGAVTGHRNSRSFGASANGVSFGRYVKSDGGTDFVPMSLRTFGADQPITMTQFRTGTGLGNTSPRIGPIVISEIMYHPQPIISGGMTNDNSLDEFIELANVSNNTQPLFDPDFPTNTWHLTGGVSYSFPTNQHVAANGRLVVVNFDPKTNQTQLAEFRTKYNVDVNVPLYGPYSGALGNHIDIVQIERPDPVQAPPHPDAGFVPFTLVERVKYEDGNGWPTNADGTGLSLHRLSYSGYANDQTNWFASSPNPGIGDTPLGITTQPTNLTVTAGRTAAFTVVASGTAPLRYQWRRNGTNLTGKTAATLSIANVQPVNAGDYTVRVSNSGDSITSVVATLTVIIPPETTRPVLVVTSPNAALIRVPTNTIKIAGTASDAGSGVNVVLLSQNSGAFQPAIGTTTWMATYVLSPGSNIFRVKAIDVDGNSSLTNTRVVVYALSNALSLVTAGQGTIKGATNGQLLELGKRYTITAIPKVGNLFSNWTSGGSALSTNPVLNFPMSPSLDLTANFVANPFLTAKGIYNGLVMDTNNVAFTNAGMINLTVTDKGIFSGKLLLGGANLPLAGSFGVDGKATVNVNRTGKPALTNRLVLDLVSKEVLGGTVSDGAFTVSIEANKAVFTITNPAPYAGKYTLIIPGTNEVIGDGIGTVSVNPAGTITLAGALADGTVVNQSVPVSRAGWWPVYLPLYTGKGMFISWAQFDTNGTINLLGDAVWIKTPMPGKYYTNGFRLLTRIEGGEYEAPAVGPTNLVLAMTNGIVTLSAGTLSTPIVNGVVLTNNNVLRITGTNGLKLMITTSSGLVSGSFIHPVTKVLTPIKAVVQQGRTNIDGFFLGTNVSGTILLQP